MFWPGAHVNMNVGLRLVFRNGRGAPPSTAISQTFVEPLSFEPNASVRPSGDQTGFVFTDFRDVSCLGVRPSIGTTKMLDAVPPPLAYAMRVPSGEKLGLETWNVPVVSSDTWMSPDLPAPTM